MKFGFSRRNAAGPVIEDCEEEAVKEFCQARRGQRDSACRAHYDGLWRSHDSLGAITVHRCPYGLVTTSSIGGRSNPVSLTGFWVDGVGSQSVPEPVRSAAGVSVEGLGKILSFMGAISSGIRDEELSHFEAAIHDARHLNHSISQNAESLMRTAGWAPDSHWDMQAIQKDNTARRALSIFAASRDLSQAIMMHEISRQPGQAKRDINHIQIHKLFYRQRRISQDRMDAAGVTVMLGETMKKLRLSEPFKLIPKILLDNSIKYASRDSEIAVSFNESSQFFVIECRNYGPIVKDAELEEIFKQGVRGSNKSGQAGQGLGLWLAKTIVEANNGFISMSIVEKSRDYSGRRLGNTSVKIKLPI